MKQIKTIRELMKTFPDDDACLEHIFRTHYADRFECTKCLKEAKFYRIKKRRAYECEHCGYQLHPTAGTPFENTRTPLTDWFYVMFMFTTSRNGVAAKEVQRQIGVTYKTAWRMCNRIRRYMGYVDGDIPIGGPTGRMVEVDKTYIGGYDKIGEDYKAIVLGMVERGGDVVTRIVADKRETTVVPEILRWVKPGSRITTDTGGSFYNLHFEDFEHFKANHQAKQYVVGDAHTNSIEGFWAAIKRGINGTYISVSQKWLQTYLWEFEFRHNLRNSPELMFDLLLHAFPGPALKPSPTEAD